MNYFLGIVLIIAAIAVLFFIFKQAAKASEIKLSAEQELQWALINKFVDTSPGHWYDKCKTKEEILAEGRLALWETTQNLRELIATKVEGDNLVVDPTDNNFDFMNYLTKISKIAITLTLAEEGLLPINSPDALDIEDHEG